MKAIQWGPSMNIQRLLTRALGQTFTPRRVEYSLPRSMIPTPPSHTVLLIIFWRSCRFPDPGIQYQESGDLLPLLTFEDYTQDLYMWLLAHNVWQWSSLKVYLLTASSGWCLLVVVALGTLTVTPSPAFSVQLLHLSFSRIFASCCHRPPLCQC